MEKRAQADTDDHRLLIRVLLLLSAIAIVGWFVVRSAASEAPKSRQHSIQASGSSVGGDVVSTASASSPETPQVRIAAAHSAAPVAPPNAGGDSPEVEHDARGKMLADAEKLYQDTFQNEQIDPQWARASEIAILNTYARDDLKALHVKAVCHSTMCRVDVDYTDPVEGQLAAKKFLQVEPWPGKRMSHMNSDSKSGVSYLARQGTQFPALPYDEASVR